MGKILLRRNSTAAAQPTAAQIEPGELAINTADGLLFTELSNGAVVNLPVKSIEGQEISPSAVTTTGSVGVGTNSPGARLEVRGSGVLSDTSALSVTNSAGGSLLFVRNDGNVGIGTGTPSYKLSVDGDIAIVTGDASLRFPNSWGFDRITFRTDVANRIASDMYGNYSWFVADKNWSLPDVSSAGIGTTEGGSRLVVRGSGTTSATSALNVQNSSADSMLFVRNDGNVGIGTTTPGEKLSVNGVVGATRASIGSNNVLETSATFGSVIAGTRAKASMYGEVAHASGGFGNVEGTAQHRVFVARGLTLSGPVTISIGSPTVFTRTGHSLSVGDTVRLSTTGALPTGLNTATNYYVISAGLSGGNTFQLSATRDGPAIDTSGTQSGTHTILPTTSLTLNGAIGLAAPALMVIPARSTWSYNIKLSAYSSQNNQGAAWWLVGGLRRNLSTTIEIETTQGFQYSENSFGSGLVSVDADSLTNSLDIRVTGVANQSVRWAAVIDLVQVSFGTP